MRTREQQRADEQRWLAQTPLRSIIKHARFRAREKGIEFTIKETDLTIPNVCPVLGIPLGQHLDRDNWISIDRTDNTVGYIPGNVQIISYKANRSKNNMSPAELMMLANYFNKETV